MLVQRGSLQLRQIKADGLDIVTCLAEQLMASQMVLGQRYQFWVGLEGYPVWRRREELRIDVRRDLLHADFIVASFGRYEKRAMLSFWLLRSPSSRAGIASSRTRSSQGRWRETKK